MFSSEIEHYVHEYYEDRILNITSVRWQFKNFTFNKILVFIFPDRRKYPLDAGQK